jgi:hypothetical protein
MTSVGEPELGAENFLRRPELEPEPIEKYREMEPLNLI